MRLLPTSPSCFLWQYDVATPGSTDQWQLALHAVPHAAKLLLCYAVRYLLQAPQYHYYYHAPVDHMHQDAMGNMRCMYGMQSESWLQFMLQMYHQEGRLARLQLWLHMGTN